MNQQNPIESKVADTILERPMQIRVGEKFYDVAPPTTATLILVSELVALLPEIKEATAPYEILAETLRIAKDCKRIAEIPAVIMLGAKGLTGTRREEKRRFGGLIKEVKEYETDRKQALADELLHSCSPRELSQLTARLLMTLEIGDFFGFTTSLREINLAKPTKREVGTIVSGQS